MTNPASVTIWSWSKMWKSRNFPTFSRFTWSLPRLGIACHRSWSPIGVTLPMILLRLSSFFQWSRSLRERKKSSERFFSILSYFRFYGLQIRTNLVHYQIFMVFSLLAYMVCSYFTLVKLTLPLFMLRYSSMTYRLVAVRVRNLSVPQITAGDLKKVIELHRKAFEWVFAMKLTVNNYK